MNESCVVYGSSGTGKSTGVMSDAAQEVGEKAMLIIDPQGKTAMTLLSLIEGVYGNVLIDDLRRTDRVLPMSLLRSSVNPDQMLREWENKRYREQLIEIIGRKSEQSMRDHPLIVYGLETAFIAYQSQKARVPLWMIRDIFKPWSPWHWQLVYGCSDKIIAELLRKLRKNMHEATRQSVYGPAERRIEAIFGEPAVIVRDSDREPDMERIVREKYVVFVVGGPGVSPEAFRTVSAIWSLRFIHHFENSEHGLARIIMDEFANYSLVGEPEIRALNTARKTGLCFTLISQSPPEDEHTRESIEENCGKRIAYRCGSAYTAEHVAKWLTLDAYKVHHTTERVMSDGYESVRQTGWSNNDSHGFTTSWRDMDRTSQRIVTDKQYERLSDQRMLAAYEIQNNLV